MVSKYLAMVKVFPKALTDPTDSAIITVIDAFLAVIVPELADSAVVPCSTLTTLYTMFRGGLGGAAEHTKHILRFFSIKGVVLHFIMAKSASVPPFAGRTLQLYISFIVGAA